MSSLAITDANFAAQREVVKEEKRQRYDNQPYGQALTKVYATVFPPGHPYHHPTIGSMEDLDAASVQDVHDFFRRHYGPDNTVLTIVGDVITERARELVELYFGSTVTPGATEGEFSYDATVVRPKKSYVIDVIGEPATLVGSLDFPDGPTEAVQAQGGTVSFEELEEVVVGSVVKTAEGDFAEPRNAQ